MDEPKCNENTKGFLDWELDNYRREWIPFQICETIFQSLEQELVNILGKTKDSISGLCCSYSTSAFVGRKQPDSTQ